jgi:hypothetical protein
VFAGFGACCVCAGGVDGIARLLGPKISLRVAGTGEINPVDGVAEKSEFCAGAACGAIATTAYTRAGDSRPRKAAVADALVMTQLFSAEIEAISSRVGVPVCGLINAVVAHPHTISEAADARCSRTAQDPSLR